MFSFFQRSVHLLIRDLSKSSLTLLNVNIFVFIAKSIFCKPIYTKSFSYFSDPSICLSELYAKVHKAVTPFAPGPKPEPLSPKPHLGDNGSPEGHVVSTEEEIYGPAPEVPKKSIDLRYSEIVFDDDKPGLVDL